MSETNSCNWTPLPPDSWLLVIPGVAEALVAPRDDMFEACVFKLPSQEAVWHGEYPTARGAKLASRAVVKGLDELSTVALIGQAAVEREVPESMPMVVPTEQMAVTREAPQSIWKPTRLQATLKGNGIVVTCDINVLDDCVEGVTRLSGHNFRDIFPDLWSAKHGTVQLAQMLIDRHVCA